MYNGGYQYQYVRTTRGFEKGCKGRREKVVRETGVLNKAVVRLLVQRCNGHPNPKIQSSQSGQSGRRISHQAFGLGTCRLGRLDGRLHCAPARISGRCSTDPIGQQGTPGAPSSEGSASGVPS